MHSYFAVQWDSIYHDDTIPWGPWIFWSDMITPYFSLIASHSLSHETFAFGVLPRVGAGWDVAELRDGVEAHPGVVEGHEAHVVVPDDLLRQDLSKIIHTSDSILHSSLNTPEFFIYTPYGLYWTSCKGQYQNAGTWQPVYLSVQYVWLKLGQHLIFHFFWYKTYWVHARQLH